MYNTTDSTLNELYFFIDKIKDRLSYDELNELTDIYNDLTLNVEDVQEIENDLFQLQDNEQAYTGHIETTMSDVQVLLYNWDDEKPVHELMDKVSEIVEREVNIPEKETNTQVLQENEILKMVKQGYKFISGLGAKIYNDYLARIGKAEQEKKQAQEFRKLQGSLQLKNAKVESVGIKVYSVYSHRQGVDAKYDATTGKVSGKGSRSLKDEIIKRVKFFLDYEQDLAF